MAKVSVVRSVWSAARLRMAAAHAQRLGVALAPKSDHKTKWYHKGKPVDQRVVTAAEDAYTEVRTRDVCCLEYAGTAGRQGSRA